MRFLTTGEVAKELRVSRRSVERWVANGVIPCLRIKATVRIPETVISSGSIIGEGVIEEGAPNKAILFNQLRTAAHFLEDAAEIFDKRVMDYLDAAVANDLIPVEKLETVMGRLHTFRDSLREIWEAVRDAEPSDIPLRDCGEGTRFASGSVA